MLAPVPSHAVTDLGGRPVRSRATRGQRVGRALERPPTQTLEATKHRHAVPPMLHQGILGGWAVDASSQ